VRLIWGDEAFMETNFTPVFPFIMYDIYVATVSSLIKLSFTCVLKSFTTYLLSLIAVLKKNLPILGDFPLLVFVAKDRGLFQSNSEIHNLNTRFNHSLHLPSTNLTLVQKAVLYSGSKIYNHLPSNIKVLSHDTKLFKSTLKSYLIEHTFHSLDEFYRSAS